MLYYLLESFIIGCCLALLAFVYSSILTEENMLLNGWFNWLDKKIGPSSAPRSHFITSTDKPAYHVGKPRAMWLFKPLIGCPRCVAGQFALWGFPLVVMEYSAKYFIFGHVLAVVASIFMVNIFAKLYKWSRN